MTADDETVWLGYAGLSVAPGAVSALLVYQPTWDRRIAQSYGTIPAGIRCVVILDDGRVLPARRTIEDLRRQLSAWQTEHTSSEHS
jgi:hypothetical protein